MDEFFDAFSGISDQDDFDLAALKYFEELDRRISGKGPAPHPAPAKEEPKQDLDPEDDSPIELKLNASYQTKSVLYACVNQGLYSLLAALLRVAHVDLGVTGLHISV